MSLQNLGALHPSGTAPWWHRQPPVGQLPGAKARCKKPAAKAGKEKVFDKVLMDMLPWPSSLSLAYSWHFVVVLVVPGGVSSGNGSDPALVPSGTTAMPSQQQGHQEVTAKEEAHMNETVKESTAEKELTKDLALSSPAGDASSAIVTDEAWEERWHTAYSEAIKMSSNLPIVKITKFDFSDKADEAKLPTTSLPAAATTPAAAAAAAAPQKRKHRRRLAQ